MKPEAATIANEMIPFIELLEANILELQQPDLSAGRLRQLTTQLGDALGLANHYSAEAMQHVPLVTAIIAAYTCVVAGMQFYVDELLKDH